MNSDLSNSFLTGTIWDTYGPLGPNSAVTMDMSSPLTREDRTPRMFNSTPGRGRGFMIPDSRPAPGRTPAPSVEGSTAEGLPARSGEPLPQAVTATLPPPVAAMTPQLEAELQEAGVSQETISKLVNHGFTAIAHLAAMDPNDPAQIGITSLGQQRVLQRLAIVYSEGGRPAQGGRQPVNPGETGPARPDTPATTPAAGSGGLPAPQAQPTTRAGPQATALGDPMGQLQDQLASLLQAMPIPADAPQSKTTPTGERMDINPLVYLLPNQKPKFKDICDYVDDNSTIQEDILGKGGDTEVVVRSNIRRIKLEQVLPMQWSAANIKILMDLLREGELPVNQIFDYLAYTVKVSSLAANYTWPSILQWDRAYRKLQQQHGFRWGSDSPHLVSLYLVPRLLVNNQSKKAKGTPGAQTPGGGSKPKNSQICRQFNRGACQYGDKCLYRHVCMIDSCQGTHPVTQHDTPKNG